MDEDTIKLDESLDSNAGSWTTRKRVGRLLRVCLAAGLLAVFLFFLFLLIFVLWLHTSSREVAIGDSVGVAMLNAFGRPRPVIVAWTEYFGEPLLPVFQPTAECPFDCAFVDRKHLLANRSAVRLFHARDFSIFDLPPLDPAALNVFFSLESPLNSEFRYHLLTENVRRRDFFNLTVTYQTKSDVFYPYGLFERIDGTEEDGEVYTDAELERAIDQKTEMALVANSNCRTDSHREYLIEDLKKRIPLTTVGKCYGVKCDDQCFTSLQRQHFFYLAFENSVCPDYVTEKFFRMKDLIVPVVLNRLSVPENVPSYAFIAVDDFATVQEFVDYLFRVIKDRQLYKSYFAWTKHFRRTNRVREALDPGCQLCRMAVEKERHQLADIRQFLSHNQCKHGFGSYLLTDRRT
ncbi:Glyco-tran-10-N domain-containing protein [Aphelenchoides fujianensis]|nr:Glyco-tran-10-N domain-containing protein [Aphelenchoides fujianensis]